MKLRTMWLAVAVLVVASAAPPAHAQSQTDEWQFSIVPLYLWAINIDGTMTIRDRFDQDFNVNFSDAFENLESAFTVHFEASKGKWGLLADVSYLNLAASRDINTPGGSADLEVTNMIVEGAGGYSFADDLWVIAGVRYFDVDVSLRFQLDAAPELGKGDSWVDGFAGLMWRPKLSDRWTLSLRGDVGAGGSDLVWNAEAIIDFAFAKWAAVAVGYKHLDYDYSSDNRDLVYDAGLSGPIFGFRFFW